MGSRLEMWPLLLPAQILAISLAKPGMFGGDNLNITLTLLPS